MEADPRLKIIELRAKAIALSDQEGVENIQKAGDYLLECIEHFKKIFPEGASLSQMDVIQGEYAWAAREWALVNESAGIIYAQKGEVKASQKAFNEAENFFVSREDMKRLKKNRKATEQKFRKHHLIP